MTPLTKKQKIEIVSAGRKMRKAVVKADLLTKEVTKAANEMERASNAAMNAAKPATRQKYFAKEATAYQRMRVKQTHSEAAIKDMQKAIREYHRTIARIRAATQK